MGSNMSQTCIHHYRIMQNSFTALNILCDPTVHSPSPLIPPPGNHWSSVSIVSPFPEHHIVGTIYCAAFSDKLLSLNKMHWKFLHIFPWVYRPLLFISKPYSTAWTYSLFIHWHHWLDGRESQWTPGVGDGQGGLACCDWWGRKESDMTEQLIWSDLIWSIQLLKDMGLPRWLSG